MKIIVFQTTVLVLWLLFNLACAKHDEKIDEKDDIKPDAYGAVGVRNIIQQILHHLGEAVEPVAIIGPLAKAIAYLFDDVAALDKFLENALFGIVCEVVHALLSERLGVTCLNAWKFLEKLLIKFGTSFGNTVGEILRNAIIYVLRGTPLGHILLKLKEHPSVELISQGLEILLKKLRHIPQFIFNIIYGVVNTVRSIVSILLWVVSFVGLENIGNFLGDIGTIMENYLGSLFSKFDLPSVVFNSLKNAAVEAVGAAKVNPGALLDTAEKVVNLDKAKDAIGFLP